jgi:ABC-type branched-subunit amino acid transport system ATPase component
MSLLSVQHVSISFGGIKALNDVSLELNRGEILGLIGPNGAGKTTLFNCISGVLQPDSGRIRMDDRSIVTLAPHERARLGLSRTFQDLQLWGSMTVMENCQLPMDALERRSMIADALRLPGASRKERASVERARAVLHALDLLEHADVPAGDLPVGLQRRVEIARALCARPELVLLDEPASGLDAAETAHLAELLGRLRDRFKVSMLLVDHDMSLVMRACHFIYVLDFGQMIAAGRPEQVRDDPKVISAYLGEGDQPEGEARGEADGAGEAVSSNGSHAGITVTPRDRVEPAAKPGQPLLEVRDLRAGYGHLEVIRNIDLEVGRGEVVACIGANGAGKTTTLRALSGVIKPLGGTVHFDGVNVTGKAPQAIVRLGMLHIPQGRGLFPKLTVDETIRLSTYSGPIQDFSVAYEAFPVLRRRGSQLVGTLSGGEQQMVAMARALLVRPKLLLLDEMSQGLAPAVVQQLFERLRLFREQGTAVFLVEQFVDSALAIADRAYIFEHGTVAHEAEAALLRRDKTLLASSYLGTAVDVEAPVVDDGAKRAQLLETVSVKLPAELKRSIEERAAREGRVADEVVLDLLGAARQEASKQ